MPSRYLASIFFGMSRNGGERCVTCHIDYQVWKLCLRSSRCCGLAFTQVKNALRNSAFRLQVRVLSRHTYLLTYLQRHSNREYNQNSSLRMATNEYLLQFVWKIDNVKWLFFSVCQNGSGKASARLGFHWNKQTLVWFASFLEVDSVLLCVFSVSRISQNEIRTKVADSVIALCATFLSRIR